LIEIIHTIEQVSIVYGSIALALMAFFISKTYNKVKKTVKIINLQSQPWVGPSDGNILSDPNPPSGKEKFIIKLKNFGELQSQNTTIHFLKKNQVISKDDLNRPNVDRTNLGSLLPEMETRYWFYMDSDEMQKARKNTAQVFIGIYISYEFSGGKNGYGLIGHFDSHEEGFVKTEMWED